LKLRIGIDVGGTHTDSVVLDENDSLVGAVKVDTTQDVISGINDALQEVLEKSGVDKDAVTAVMFGTTHFTNAVVERKNLAHVGLLRIGKPATLGVKPMFSLPKDLREAIGNTWQIVSGGHEYDGREIWEFDEGSTRAVAQEFKKIGVESVAVSAVFSPVNPSHEEKAAKIFSEVMGRETPITLSHRIGSIGLLERENGAVLNAALAKVAPITIRSLEQAVERVGLNNAKTFLTQNDGTLMNVDYARMYPVRTIACGPTNSMRGAAFLTGVRDGIIIDIGGTTALVGAITRGFPRESSVAVEIGGVRTNFRMPDLLAASCGGGTVVKFVDSAVELGPESLGFRITKDSVAWGGEVLTTTDVAVGLGEAQIDDKNCKRERVTARFSIESLNRAYEKIISTLEEFTDRMKTSAEPVPLVLVGGGGIIVPKKAYSNFRGASMVIRPEHFQFANAIGAAIAQVSGEVDKVYDLDKMTRTQAIESAKQSAVNDAVSAGADPLSVEVVEVDEIPLSYLPGTATRIRAKVVGKLIY
jgi:N-methylhydantoinase A/oxoprolinase/acetone carboxylase beta subunit